MMFNQGKLINHAYYGYVFESDVEWLNSFAKDKVTTDANNNSNCFFHTNFYPEQVVGDPNKAKIFLLNMNPSFDQTNQQTLLKFQTEIFENINGIFDPDYPFYCLNPKYNGTDSARWWRNGNHFKKWEQSFDLTKLSKAFCCLELLPYHCKKMTAKASNNITECPSTDRIIKFVHDEVVPKAKAGESAIILLRCSEKWGLVENINSNIFSTSSPRSAYFGCNMYSNTDTNKHIAFVNTIRGLIG